jgi:hypothetical protein
LDPWSGWIRVPAAGRRDWMAMPSALVTSAAVGVVSMDQPTTRREQASRTTAQYSLPSRGVLGDVGDPQLIGAGASELAVDQVAGGRLGRSPRRNLGRPVTPCRPARRINSSTA